MEENNKNVFEFEGKEYNYKTRISMEEKYVLSQAIVNGCLIKNEDNDLLYCDEILKETLLGLYIVRFYSDLELPEGNVLEIYDKLYKVVDLIENKLEDIDIIKNYVNNMVDYKVNKCQSLEIIVKNKFDELISKLPETKDYSNMLTKGVQALNSIDSNKLKIVADSIGKKDVIADTKKEVKASKSKKDVSKLS